MSKIYPLEQNKLVYKCDDKILAYDLVINHRFSEVDSHIDELSYYITVNNDRVFNNSSNEMDINSLNIYKPDHLTTVKISDDSYISLYKIKFTRNKITQNTSDEVNINLILPFDHKISIYDYNLFVQEI